MAYGEIKPVRVHAVASSNSRSSHPFRNLNEFDRDQILVSWSNGASRCNVGLRDAEAEGVIAQGACSQVQSIVPARRAASGVGCSPFPEGRPGLTGHTAGGSDASLRFALLASWELGTADVEQRSQRLSYSNSSEGARSSSRDASRAGSISGNRSPWSSTQRNISCKGCRGGSGKEAGMISLDDWASGLKTVHTAPPFSSFDRNTGNAGGGFASLSDDLDSSLRDFLAPLVTECNNSRGRITPPNVFRVQSALAAISAVKLPGANDPTTYLVSARKSLATHGFRRCDLVVDKLGVSVRCFPDEGSFKSKLNHGNLSDQFDFPWTSISDVQDPRTKKGLQGLAVTFGIREPASLGGEPSGALCLVIRLPDRVTAHKLADVALAFKVYEVQTAVWNSVGRNGLAAARNSAALLLDERGIAFWSLCLCDEPAMAEAPRSTRAVPHVLCCGGLCVRGSRTTCCVVR